MKIVACFAHWLLAAYLIATPAVAASDANAMLESADRARGGGLPGLVWNIQLMSQRGQKAVEEMRLEVRAVSEASVAETLEPVRFRGSKLLQVGNNMWMTRPGLSKPIPISSRQRMSGQAANGDIAATNYAGDYEAELEGEEMIDGEVCYVLRLTARHKRTTYDLIRYWVSEAREVGLKAEYYSVSGKLLKTARFKYDNSIFYQGSKIPFVSEMTIRDALVDEKTVMTYESVEVRKIARSEFDLNRL